MDISSADNRRSKRIPIDSIALPFMGSRDDDNLCFQYMLMDISLSGMQFAIPKWVVSRENIRDGDLVNFHIPFEFKNIFYNQGRIAWTRWDDALQAQLCGASLEQQTLLSDRVYISIKSSSVSIDLQDISFKDDLLLKVFKDSVLLKNGVLIYLKHLIPFFSRITLYPREEFPRLKEFLLDDIRNKVIGNRDRLEKIYEQIKNELHSPEDLPRVVDLEELRSLMESEIYLEIFKTTFEKGNIMPYLNAVKQLEKKLYSNYNTIVLLYVKTL